tara:strand:- start:2322 stop:3419 length:1098 start_codon:yes stop_codon:yes gene_type:complete
MEVGATLVFQNPGHKKSDFEIYQNDLKLANLAEPLGFDAVWGIEHHFTDYTMMPDVMQFLAYMAGRTERVKLGSMAVILPWHNDPIRVAEQISVVDNISRGRVILGIGRGLGRVEFDGFGMSMDEARPRFRESARLILDGLENGYCEMDGEIIKQVRRDIRPAPYKSFVGRRYGAAVSPESLSIMAELGLGLLIIPQKPWGTVAEELADYRQQFFTIHKEQAPPPFVASFVYCDENADRAREVANKNLGAYWHSMVEHYEMDGSHFKNIKGYEWYAGASNHINKDGAEIARQFFVDLHVCGTPDQCYEKILQIREFVGNDKFNGMFSFGGIAPEMAEASMRLFAKEVMPRLQKLPAPKITPAKSA